MSMITGTICLYLLCLSDCGRTTPPASTERFSALHALTTLMHHKTRPASLICVHPSCTVAQCTSLSVASSSSAPATIHSITRLCCCSCCCCCITVQLPTTLMLIPQTLFVVIILKSLPNKPVTGKCNKIATASIS